MAVSSYYESSSDNCQIKRLDIKAFHFCHHSTDLTKSARRVIDSLAYQLASSIPQCFDLILDAATAVQVRLQGPRRARKARRRPCPDVRCAASSQQGPRPAGVAAASLGY